MAVNLMNNVQKNMSDFHKLNEQISTEKKLNRISDDPAGLATAIRHRGNFSAYEQYSENIRDADEYLRMTDIVLNRFQDILTKARVIAETTATETANDMEKEIAARQIQELIDEALGLANTKMRDRYLFSGTNGEFPAYSLEGRVLDPVASTLNQYNDIVTSHGEYNGTGEFIVKFVRAGDVGDPDLDSTAMYQISSDGGQTWTEATHFTNLSLQITDSDGNPTGLNLTFRPGQIGEGDEFRLNVVKGRYMGDDGTVLFNNNMFSRVHTNVNGQELFENHGFFDTLYSLKFALESGNGLEVQENLEKLGHIQSAMQHSVTSTGQALNRLEITRGNLTMMHENVLESIQAIEKIDVVQLLTRFAMTENALNASIAALSKVFPMSLMNYI
jgi:flagellar hook-associated protein 3